MDNGATNHIITNLNHLSLQQYKGADMVTVGNGGGLHITHIGSSLISSLTTNFPPINIVICLNASSNLLSIQKILLITIATLFL